MSERLRYCLRLAVRNGIPDYVQGGLGAEEGEVQGAICRRRRDTEARERVVTEDAVLKGDGDCAAYAEQERPGEGAGVVAALNP